MTQIQRKTWIQRQREKNEKDRQTEKKKKGCKRDRDREDRKDVIRGKEIEDHEPETKTEKEQVKRGHNVLADGWEGASNSPCLTPTPP